MQRGIVLYADLPIKEMFQRGWLGDEDTLSETDSVEARLRRFAGCDSGDCGCNPIRGSRIPGGCLAARVESPAPRTEPTP